MELRTAVLEEGISVQVVVGTGSMRGAMEVSFEGMRGRGLTLLNDGLRLLVLDWELRSWFDGCWFRHGIYKSATSTP